MTKRAGSEPKRRGSDPKRQTVTPGQLEIDRLSQQLDLVTAANALLKEEAVASVLMQEKEATMLIKERAAVNVPQMQLKLSQALAAQHEAEMVTPSILSLSHHPNVSLSFLHCLVHSV